MASIYLHQHPQFADLLTIVADARGILPTLVEKDYWIMHVLHGLKKQDMKFEERDKSLSLQVPEKLLKPGTLITQTKSILSK